MLNKSPNKISPSLDLKFFSFDLLVFQFQFYTKPSSWIQIGLEDVNLLLYKWNRINLVNLNNIS